jgi:hypothetical protein
MHYTGDKGEPVCGNEGLASRTIEPVDCEECLKYIYHKVGNKLQKIILLAHFDPNTMDPELKAAIQASLKE